MPLDRDGKLHLASRVSSTPLYLQIVSVSWKRLVTRAVNKYREVHGYFMDRQVEEVGKKDAPAVVEKSIVLGGTHFDIGVDGNGRPVMGWSDKTKRGRATHPQPVLDFLCHNVMDKIEGETMHGRTEANIVLNGKKEKFRAPDRTQTNVSTCGTIGQCLSSNQQGGVSRSSLDRFRLLWKWRSFRPDLRINQR